MIQLLNIFKHNLLRKINQHKKKFIVIIHVQQIHKMFNLYLMLSQMYEKIYLFKNINFQFFVWIGYHHIKSSWLWSVLKSMLKNNLDFLYIFFCCCACSLLVFTHFYCFSENASDSLSLSYDLSSQVRWTVKIKIFLSSALYLHFYKTNI